MFTAQAWKGFIQPLIVQTQRMNAEQAVAAMVRAAEDAKQRVIGTSLARSNGVTPGVRQVVDGVAGANLTAVKPDGLIILQWNYVAEIAQDTMDALVARSPRESGDYIRGLLMFVNGQQVPDVRHAEVPEGTVTIEIVATVPYARRLEIGHLHKPGGRTFFVKQVSPHIVEETMQSAKSLYGGSLGLATFTYSYKQLPDPHMLAAGSSSIRRRHGRTVTEISHPTITITARTA